MNILRILKELYSGKDNLIAQLGIFSLVGIMAISINEVISLFTGNTFYAVFAVPSNGEVVFFALLGIMIFIFFTGYIYKFVHENYKTDNALLPSISMNCFTTFIKILPVMLLWGLYFGFACLIGMILFGLTRYEFYLYLIFLFILLPFINIVFLIFAKDFEYRRGIFNPLYLVNIMKKTFVDVFLFLFQFVALGIILSALNLFLLKMSMNGQSRTVQLILLLAVFCIVSYVQQILNLAYFKGLTEIIKKRNVI